MMDEENKMGCGLFGNSFDGGAQAASLARSSHGSSLSGYVERETASNSPQTLE